LVGQTVMFTGIVTATASQYPPFNGGFLVQDSSGPWHGVYVYLNHMAIDVSVGDSVRVTGEVSEYYGLTEVTIGSESDVEVLATGRPVPPPVQVTTSQIANDSATEPYECVLVEVRNAVVTNDNLGYGQWEVDDGSGPAIVDDAYPYSYTPSVGDTLYLLRGIVTYSYSEYKLEPRGNSDIISSIDGTGIGWVSPSTIPTSTTISSLSIGLTGMLRDHAITQVVVLVPAAFTFDTFNLEGAFEGASIQRIGPQIILSNIYLTCYDTGYIVLSNFTAPSEPDTYTVSIRTAGENGTPQPIPNMPTITVLPVSGTGIAWVSPSMIPAAMTIPSLSLGFTGIMDNAPITEIVVLVPTAFTFDTFSLEGAFENATVQQIGPQLTLSNIEVTSNDTGYIIFSNFTAPSQPDTYTVSIRTAGENGSPQPIPEMPTIAVLPVSGTGTASMTPFMLTYNDTVDMVLNFTGEFGVVQALGVVIPAELLNWNTDPIMEGVFSDADYEMRGDTLVLWNFSAGVGETGRIVFPAVTTYEGFYDSSRVVVMSGTDTTNLAPLQASPLVVVESPDSTQPFVMIGKVQEPGPDGYSSALEGQFVSVIGVVIGPSSAFSSSGRLSMYIQDVSGGVNVYTPSWSGGSFRIGQLVSLYGRVTEYNGLTEMVLEGPNCTLQGEGYSFDTLRLKTSEPLSERHEGRLIEVTGEVATVPIGAGAGRSFTVWNGFTPITVYAYNTTGVDLSEIQPGKLVRIVGIGGQYDREAPYDAGYQLLVRMQSDIQIIGQGQESDTVSINVSPNVFAPSLGEVAEITVTGPMDARYSLRVYDARGRVVRHIYDGKPGPVNAFWRGDDDYGAPINVGLYFVRLFVQYPDGRRESVTKTVVVGADF